MHSVKAKEDLQSELERHRAAAVRAQNELEDTKLKLSSMEYEISTLKAASSNDADLEAALALHKNEIASVQESLREETARAASLSWSS